MHNGDKYKFHQLITIGTRDKGVKLVIKKSSGYMYDPFVLLSAGLIGIVQFQHKF